MTSAHARRLRGSTPIGWRADGRSATWAAIGGIAASIVIGIPMTMMGMILMGPAQLVGSDSLSVGWIVHILAGLIFAVPYGLFVHRVGYGKGLLYGAIWGLIVGVLFAWLALFTILGMPLFSQMGAIDVAMHVLWGMIVGVVAAWGLRK